MDTGKQSLAQNVKLKCRVCKKDIYRKNYKSHLQNTHPSQNCDDMSPHGQIKLTSMFAAPAPPKPTDVVALETEAVLTDQNER